MTGICDDRGVEATSAGLGPRPEHALEAAVVDEFGVAPLARETAAG
jgi:hypothetical protein